MTSNPPPIPGVILAGGRSRRMGSDKALVRLGGISLLDRAVARFAPQVSSLALNADEERPGHEALPLVPDEIPGKAGPLAGVLAAMRYAAGGEASHVATVPIDSPFFPRDLISRLSNNMQASRSIIIATCQGREHPVFGLWSTALADDLATWLENGENRRVRDFLLRHDVREVSFPLIETRLGQLDPFFNVNNPQDLADAEKWLEVIE
ncbi:molybdenum cofactor guanylyltransferase MobA [Rhizobium sp. BK251]|uniref:molybdenum cofactor guanylyltransferase MobA n=1 Tax=Rhizobium sp. BK251 TaxID=2512125 RepID=UPI001042E50C|nr:molybdenum cofactor guanylyltransferase MobA [Rhizobium sp. BK251]TCL75061.1 molybdenum cofactor guanylyltransferase [Rhizobium sp. BK251]